MRLIRLRRGISEKILLGFAAMALLIGALGAHGYYVLRGTGGIVADTYDRPLMTVNYARAADQTFTEMEKELWRRESVPPAQRAAITARLPGLARSFHDDLGVAYERASSDEERKVIANIREEVARWIAIEAAAGESVNSLALQQLSTDIAKQFDRLVELVADSSFVERRKGLSAITQYEYTTIGSVLLALLTAGFITYLLARHIVQPLSTAAKVADRIASGQLDTVIPRGFDDETGILLHSMSVMRDAIRTMMARERMQRRSAQTRLADALESSREGMVLVDAMGSIVIANSQIGEFFPAARANLEGRDFATIEVMIGEHLLDPAAAPNLMALPATGDEFQLADNRWIRVSRSQTRDGGAFFFFTDFTEVKEREQRYREAQLQAEAASRAKSSFLANMSHELRTPLNAIIGFSEIMQKEMYGAVGNEHYTAYIYDILQSGKHLLAIINGVLDLAKSQSGKLKIHREPVDMGEILADCVSMMREQCARGGLQLDYDHPCHPVVVSGEPAKLRQIFLNLLSNAVKFTEPGGRIALTLEESGATVAIAVADSGIGMAPDEVVVALTPFGQVDSRLARRYEGTGLGLPLAKELVELHGGTLAVASEPGHGTNVRVTLPTVPAEVATIETVAA